MIEKTVLEKLYIERKLSMKEIGEQLNLSANGISYWMKKYSISRRGQKEATYHKRNPNGDPYKIKSKLNRNDVFLLGLGLGLYWGEGNKANINSIRLGNTDPRLINSYLKFLLDICGVEKSKIHFQLQLFNDLDQDTALEFWINKTSFDRKHFRSVYYSKTQGKGSYRKKCKYGVLTVLVGNKKLRNWLISRLINVTNNRPIV